jgi:hypothetical protein
MARHAANGVAVPQHGVVNLAPPRQMLAVSTDNSLAAPSDELDSQGTVSAPVPPETVAGGLVSRLRALFDKRRVTVAELASLLAWLLTGVSFVVTKRSFEDASPLVRPL